ncbi:MAG: hypothetical protein JRN19_01590 [Nitrososphaerota archaeon]|nr:hypothetical protein [Nitrososphaerota archaeon]MDG7034942.1 hypothetical protein [Nitrososphaerota archaeon]MDG7035960.1 hypothetical protein [Nitrososphaerota archaeon]MDG7037579.1 hypothetical protein [Nitrososphaerota archaeon]MDG7039738.1 hypothetical protein [Nitrososphaerota archaeon]
MYRYLDKTWQEYYSKKPEQYRALLIKWRSEPTIHREERPIRLDKARKIGYRAKGGFIAVMAKVSKGGMNIHVPTSGRRPKHYGAKKISGVRNAKLIAIERVKKRYKNMKVMGAYYLGEDGNHKWFEVVLKDEHLLPE